MIPCIVSLVLLAPQSGQAQSQNLFAKTGAARIAENDLPPPSPLEDKIATPQENPAPVTPPPISRQYQERIIEQQADEEAKDDEKAQKAHEFLKKLQKVLRGPAPPPPLSKPQFDTFKDENGGSSRFLYSAHKCGIEMQAECTPDHFGGRTMCGLGVAKMIKCMATENHMGTPDCGGACGNGKDFVDCANGAMTRCGYVKIKNVNSRECSLPGAVLSYTKTPTVRGQIYGHVEFVCDSNQTGTELKYCSIYSHPHDDPWPRDTPDGCWYPDPDARTGGH